MNKENKDYYLRATTTEDRVGIDCGSNSSSGTSFYIVGSTLDEALLNIVSQMCKLQEENTRLRSTIGIINISCKSVIEQ
jgi:hypothetical protein